MTVVYFIIVMILLFIFDLKDLKKKKQKKEMVIYATMMILVGILGVFYFVNPERQSFSEIILSLIGQ